MSKKTCLCGWLQITFAQGYKNLFILYSTEHEIYPENKDQNTNNFNIFPDEQSWAIIGILAFISWINCYASLIEHEKVLLPQALTVHHLSIIGAKHVSFMESKGSTEPSCRQQKLWSDCADALADLSLCQLHAIRFIPSLSFYTSNLLKKDSLWKSPEWSQEFRCSSHDRVVAKCKMS